MSTSEEVCKYGKIEGLAWYNALARMSYIYEEKSIKYS